MRKSFNDFSGGQVDKVEPYLIPDNACVEIKNYEITIAGSLQKRKKVEPAGLGSFSNLGAIKKIFIWYPSNKPTGASDDEVYVVYYSDNLLYLFYNTVNGYLNEPITAVNYTSESVIEGFAGADRFLIADGINKGHYIFINPDGEITFGILGIKGTKYKPSITTIDTYKASYFEENSDKSYFDECGLVQVAIVFVDRYGNRSSPSPGSNVADFQYFKKDEGATARWLKKVTVSNIRVPKGLNADVLDDLEDVEIYARIHRYSEGAESSVYTLCKTVHIGSKEYDPSGIPSANSYTITLHNPDAREIEYVSYQAPICKHITEVSNVIFTGNLKERETDLFPYEFDNVCKIELDNVNAQTYINGLVKLVFYDENSTQLVGKYITNLDWSDFLNAGVITEPNRLRIYDSDRKTALRVAYTAYPSSSFPSVILVQIPKIFASSVNAIYFCFGGEGITDTEFQNYEYGEFIKTDDSSFLEQNMFQSIKVKNVNCSICSPMKEVDTKIINTADDSSSIIIDSDTNNITIINKEVIYLPDNEMLLSRKCIYIISGANSYARYDYARLLPERGTIFIRMYGNFYSADTNVKNHIAFCGNGECFGLGCQRNADAYALGVNQMDFYIYDDNMFYWPGSGYSIIYTPSGVPTKALIMFSWDISGDDEEHKFSLFAMDSMNYLVTFAAEITTPHLCENSWSKVTEMEYLGIGKNSKYGGELSSYYSQIQLIEDEFWENSVDNKNRFRNIANAMPDFGTEFLGYVYDPAEHNKNVYFNETEQLNIKARPNWAQWSDINGTNFNSGYLRKLQDEITAIVPFKTALADAIYPSVAYFTPSTLVRMVLQGTDAGLWVDNTQSMFEEYFGFGLYAINSVQRRGDDIIWYSPKGIMQIGKDGLQNLSEHIVDIPLDDTYRGIYIPLKDQYFLHRQATEGTRLSKTYVYDFLHKAFVTFTGLDIDFAQFYQRGSRKNLFLDSNKDIQLYPSDVNYDDDFEILTKQYQFDNPFYERFRIDFEGTCDVTVTVKNPDTEVVNTFTSIDRMKLRGLSLASWGEYIQFLITNVDKLKRVDFDIINR